MYAKKLMGQHFLKCRWAVSALIKAADIGPDDTILEVGPGTGILTRALAQRAKRIVAVEKDEGLASELENGLAEEKIENIAVVKGDILQLPLSRFRLDSNYKAVANIPYYLTSRLLRLLLGQTPKPTLIVLTIQKEVAQRICARPPKMNLLALSVQAFGSPKIIKTVPADCFFPKPKVESAIIKISDISDGFFRENHIKSADFFQIARRCFSQKRKIILNSFPKEIPKQKAGRILASASISPLARPEELTREDWTKIVLNIIKTRS